MEPVQFDVFHFCSSRIIYCLGRCCHEQTQIPLKPVLWDVRDVALLIISHEQTKKTESAIFISAVLNWLLSRDRLLQEILFLVIFRDIKTSSKINRCYMITVMCIR